MLRRHEILLTKLSLDDVLRLGEIFDYGLTADWNTCDWVRVRFSEAASRVTCLRVPQNYPLGLIKAMADAMLAWMSTRFDGCGHHLTLPGPADRAVPWKYARARATASRPTRLPALRPTKSSGWMWMPP